MFTLRQSLGALAVLAAPLAYAIPVTTFSRVGASSNGITISQLKIHEPTGASNSTSNTTMSFAVDTHSMKTICTGQWAPEGPYPEGGYIPCNNSSLQWNFEDGSYTSLNQFTIQLEYTFEDDSVGPYPYNKVTEFSKANVTQNDLTCTTQTDCEQCGNSTINAVVWASIAK